MTRNLLAIGARRTPAFLFALISAAVLGCGSDTTEPQIRDVASIDLTIKPELEIGDRDVATAIARDESGQPIAGAAVTWSSTFPAVAVVTPDGEITTKAIGNTEIVASAGGKETRKQLTVFPPQLLINEVNPDGNSNGGWVEVFNSTPNAINLGGWFLVTLIGPNHVDLYVFPNGSVIGPGEFVVVDEALIPGSLNANGTVVLFSRFGVESDVMQWTNNVSGNAFARCPDNDRFGSLVATTVPTRRAANVCRP